MTRSDLDWRWLKSFLAVADAGGMHAAASAGASSQPTLSRHIQQLEESLNVSLFHRSGRALTLTTDGAALYERACEVRAAVLSFERQASGLVEEEAGSVRVTMSLHYASHFAPKWMKRLREEHPHISIDLVANDMPADLLLGEAEIAIRLFRPTQLDLISRRCGVHHLGFFASSDYLEEHGSPGSLDDLGAHELIGFDRSTTWIDTARSMGYHFDRESFQYRTDLPIIHTELARAGAGIAALPTWLGRRCGLIRLFEDVTVGELPVFLAAHKDLHRNPRVSRVWKHLISELDDLLANAPPPSSIEPDT